MPSVRTTFDSNTKPKTIPHVATFTSANSRARSASPLSGGPAGPKNLSNSIPKTTCTATSTGMRRGVHRKTSTYSTAMAPADTALAARRTGPFAPSFGMSVRRPAGRNVKNTPARNTACDRTDIDCQNLFRVDQVLAPAMALSIKAFHRWFGRCDTTAVVRVCLEAAVQWYRIIHVIALVRELLLCREACNASNFVPRGLPL